MEFLTKNQMQRIPFRSRRFYFPDLIYFLLSVWLSARNADFCCGLTIDFVLKEAILRNLIPHTQRWGDRIKNTWTENSPYKGINTTVTSPSGQTFELQFHTKQSYDLKNGELHRLYEESRVLSEASPKKTDIDQQMLELSSQLDRPKDIDKVVSK